MTFEIYVPQKKKATPPTFIKCRFDEKSIYFQTSADFFKSNTEYVQILVDKTQPKKIAFQKCDQSAQGAVHVKNSYSGRRPVLTLSFKWDGYRPASTNWKTTQCEFQKNGDTSITIILP